MGHDNQVNTRFWSAQVIDSLLQTRKCYKLCK